MNAVMKLSFLIILASVSIITNAAPVQDDLVIAATVNGVDDGGRETRSTDNGTVPWHLDRIDQRKSHLDGKYNPFANGN